jgi:hypothetical protein
MDVTATRSGLLLALLLFPPTSLAGETPSAKLGKRCDKGQGAACAELAERWADAPRAACEQGATTACLGLARAELSGLGADDPQRALDAYDQACFLGLDEACRRMAVIRALEADPDHPIAPLELYLSPTGLRIEGVGVSFFSDLQLDGDAIVFPCTRDDGCERASHFDFEALDRALEQIEASDPSRTQAVLRTAGVQHDAVLQAMRSLAGPDGDRFPAVVTVEVAP